jgi:lipoate synthase
MKEFTNVTREVARKRNGFIPIKILPADAKLQERTRNLGEWRKQHEQLAVMSGPMKGLGGDMEEVKEAYEVVKRIDVLDVSVGVWFHLTKNHLGRLKKLFF